MNIIGYRGRLITASAGGHASDWSLAIHFHTIGWSLAWSLACLFLE